MVKKKLLGIAIILLIFCCFVVIKINNKIIDKDIYYDGSNLLVTIDDKTMDALPSSGNYYLTSYECDNTNIVFLLFAIASCIFKIKLFPGSKSHA